MKVGTPSPRRLAGTAAVVLLCIPYTYAAIRAFPLWDDAWIWLLLREEGVAAVAPSFADRPVNAAIWSWLAAHQALFPAGFVAQALFWPLLGGVGALLWLCLHPERRGFAALAALLTVAPFVTKVQPVTVNVALASLLPTLLAYGALLLLWRYVSMGARWTLVAATAMSFAGILIQEYAVAVVLIGLVLLGAEAVATLDPRRRWRAAVAAAVLVVGAGLAYALFLQLGDPSVRQDTRPAHIIETWDRVEELPAGLAVATWRVLVGGVVDSARLRLAHTEPLLPALLMGALVAALLVYAGAGRQRPDAAAEPATGARSWARELGLFAALLAGIAPVLVMGRIPWDPGDGMTSRYGLPALPIAALLMTRAISALDRRRIVQAVVAALGLLAGSTAWVEARDLVVERRLVAALGEAVRPHVSEHEQFTVAVVPLPERPLGPRRQWELVARLAARWPVDLERRLWAYRFGGGPPLDYREDARRIVGPRHSCRFPERLSLDIRRLTRRGRVHTLAWLAPSPNGVVTLEPYCR